MSGSVSFNQIPASVRVPGTYIEIDNSRALRGLTDWPAKVALIGQRVAAGTVSQAIPTRVTTADQARQYFGRGSNLAHMFEAWFRANPLAEVWGIALDDNVAGVAPTCTVTVTGPSTAAGTIVLLIGGRRVEVAVASGAAQNTIATAIQAAIAALADLPVTAAAATNVVTLTFRHKGTIGNSLDVRHSYYPGEALPAGVALAITAMSGGTTNPSLQTALDAAADTWFTDWVLPYTDATNLTALEAKLSAMGGPMQMRDAHGWTAISDTYGNLTTFGGGRNSQFVSALALRGSPTPHWEWIATLAGVCVPALATDPARPVQTLAVPGVLPPAIASRFTYTERDQLLRVGLSTIRWNDAGQAFVERVVTTYQTGPSGQPDISFLDVETMKTLAYLRWDLRTIIAQRFPRMKLADDGSEFARGQAVVTPSVIRSEIIARFRQWESAGLVEGIEQFKQDILVVRNASDPNRVDALVPPDIVNQLRVVAAQIRFFL